MSWGGTCNQFTVDSHPVFQQRTSGDAHKYSSLSTRRSSTILADSTSRSLNNNTSSSSSRSMARSTARETVSHYCSSTRRSRLAGARKITKYRKGPSFEVLKQRLSTTYPSTTRVDSTFDDMVGRFDPFLDQLGEPTGRGELEGYRNRLLPVENAFTDLNHSAGATTTKFPTAGGNIRS
ncbi:hypothetical protein BJ508DRAFT_316358, partial [Ascobolus immersus RN42]